MTNEVLPDTSITYGQVFGATTANATNEYMRIDEWTEPILYLVGRNGSGKSKAAKAIAAVHGGRYLATDRLVGLMKFVTYQWGAVPTDYQGIPLADGDRNQVRTHSLQHGSATDELYAVRELPHVWLRVAAFLRRTLGRVIELRESAGFLDPFVRVGGVEYSLLRDEGHGLRELVVLLVAAYRDDWRLLVVDEPELHMHPSMARLWLTELRRSCQATGGRAIVVTHEPSLLTPATRSDLNAIWHFGVGRGPIRVGDCVLPVQAEQVAGSLASNPALLSDLMFSPRPVLVEGEHDAAALSVALARTHPAETVAQTDFVRCGGDTGVATWFEIATKCQLDVRAVCDLDALLDGHVQQVMDRFESVQAMIRTEFAIEPPTTARAIRELLTFMDSKAVTKDTKSRSAFLASVGSQNDGHAERKRRVLEVWKQAGLWLHPQGTLEQVLGISKKGVVEARTAAATPGDIDQVAAWCAYELDMSGDVKELLGAAVEQIAHGIVEAQRLDPEAEFAAPVGGSAANDPRLVTVEPVGTGLHRITVIAPPEFAGYWVEFSRDTSPNSLVLQPPSDKE